MLAPYTAEKPPAGVKRYTFVPNAALKKQLDAKSSPDEVPDPPCGDWGDAPDGIQYFEAQPASGARKVLFVRVGQDEPLFDEKTLRLMAPASRRGQGTNVPGLMPRVPHREARCSSVSAGFGVLRQG